MGIRIGICSGNLKQSFKKKSSLGRLKLTKPLFKDGGSSVLESLQQLTSLCQGDLILTSLLPVKQSPSRYSKKAETKHQQNTIIKNSKTHQNQQAITNLEL